MLHDKGKLNDSPWRGDMADAMLKIKFTLQNTRPYFEKKLL